MLDTEVTPMDEWLTVKEVSSELKVTPETVRRWLRTGVLEGKILSDRGGWRVRRSVVDRFMEEDGERRELDEGR